MDDYVFSAISNTCEHIMNFSLLIGTFSRLRKVHLNYIISVITNYVSEYS